MHKKNTMSVKIIAGLWARLLRSLCTKLRAQIADAEGRDRKQLASQSDILAAEYNELESEMDSLYELESNLENAESNSIGVVKRQRAIEKRIGEIEARMERLEEEGIQAEALEAGALEAGALEDSNRRDTSSKASPRARTEEAETEAETEAMLDAVSHTLPPDPNPGQNLPSRVAKHTRHDKLLKVWWKQMTVLGSKVLEIRPQSESRKLPTTCKWTAFGKVRREKYLCVRNWAGCITSRLTKLFLHSREQNVS